MGYYFAYGSNMDKNQLKKRGVNFFDSFSGKLFNYKLVFQEFLLDENKNSYANIIFKKNSFVEGIVFEVDSSIKNLDSYECVPQDYFKKYKNVLTEKGIFSCLVYIGNKKNIGLEKNPKKNYLKKILRGKNYLSKGYYKKLNSFLE